MLLNNVKGKTSYKCTWIISKYMLSTENIINCSPLHTVNLGNSTWRLSVELQDPGCVKKVLCYLRRLSGDEELLIDFHFQAYECNVRLCHKNIFGLKLEELKRIHVVSIPTSKEQTTDPNVADLVFECILEPSDEKLCTDVSEIDFIPITKEQTTDPNIADLVFESTLEPSDEKLCTGVSEIDLRQCAELTSKPKENGYKFSLQTDEKLSESLSGKALCTRVLENDSRQGLNSQLNSGGYNTALQTGEITLDKNILMGKLKNLAEKLDFPPSFKSYCFRKLPNISTATLNALLLYACTGSVSISDETSLMEIHRIAVEYELSDLYCKLHSWTHSCVMRSNQESEKINFTWKIGDIIAKGSWIARPIQVSTKLGGLLRISCRTAVGFNGLLYLYVWFNFPHIKDTGVFMSGTFGFLGATCPLDKFKSVKHLFRSRRVQIECLKVPKYILNRSDETICHELKLDLELHYGSFSTQVINRYTSIGSQLPIRKTLDMDSLCDSTVLSDTAEKFAGLLAPDSSC